MADFRDLKGRVIDNWRGLAKWREQAREDYAFYAGDQWSEEDRQALEQTGRAAIVFNRIAPVIDSVVGSEITNRTEVAFYPREIGDSKPSEVRTAAAQWFRDLAGAEEEDSDAFQDCAICGVGWTETRLDMEESEEGEPKVDRIDPLEMFWDRNARKKNLTDARIVGRVIRVSRAEAREMFPGKAPEDVHCGWIDTDSLDDEDPTHRRIGDQFDGSGDEDLGSDGRVVVVQVQWREREEYRKVADPLSGQMEDFSEDEYRQAERRLAEMDPTAEIQSVRLKRWVYRQAFLGATEILEEMDSPAGPNFSFLAITGKRHRNSGRWYGLVRSMRDPQMWANKWLVQSLHIMNANSKGGIMAEQDAFANVDEAQEDWARPDTITWLSEGALSGEKPKILPKPQIQFPAPFMNMTEFAVSSIRDVTGVNLEMLGMREANQAGVLEMQRRQSALMTLAKLFDSLRTYRKNQGKILGYFIDEYLSDGRLVRIVGSEGAKYVPLMRQPGGMKYDTVVDEAPSSPDQKAQTWQVLSAMLPAFKEALMANPQILAEVLEYSPLPASLVEKLKSTMQGPKNDPAAQMMQQLEAAQKQADVEKTKSEATENMAGAQLDMAKAHRERVEPIQAPVVPTVNGASPGGR